MFGETEKTNTNIYGLILKHNQSGPAVSNSGRVVKNRGANVVQEEWWRESYCGEIIEYECYAKEINAQSPKFRENFGSGALGTVKRQFSAVLSSEVKAIDCSKEPPKWQRDGTSELAEFQDIK